jgi:hypothetical protein
MLFTCRVCYKKKSGPTRVSGADLRAAIQRFVFVLCLLTTHDLMAHGAWPRHPGFYPAYPGVNLYWNGIYGWPGGYPQTVYVPVPSTPPTYIERDSAEPHDAPLLPGFWYYCWQPAGFYPDVPDCPGGWQAVPPRN